MPGKGEPGDPGGRDAGGDAGNGQRQRDRLRPCAAGSLELNAFLPLIADCLLENLDVLARADDVLARLCVNGIEADEARCRAHVENSTAAATALVPALGYERAGEAARLAPRNRGRRCARWLWRWDG